MTTVDPCYTCGCPIPGHDADGRCGWADCNPLADGRNPTCLLRKPPMDEHTEAATHIQRLAHQGLTGALRDRGDTDPAATMAILRRAVATCLPPYTALPAPRRHTDAA
jgi:hypothetical protein